MRARLIAALTAATLASPAVADEVEKRPVIKSKKVDRVSALEKRLEALEAELATRPRDVSAYALPDEVDFCGVPVDLAHDDVRERMEKEFYLVLGDRAQVVLWIKRARAVFPTVEKEAKRLGTCADLKYLAVVESGLRPAVESRASAKGWWQFMSGTGRQYGLDVDRAWDQRADLGQATTAGLTYLQVLHDKFGSWPLAMAAYNTGPGRLQRAQNEQGLTNFWDLDLYTEAERYVPRAIAIKTVMENLDAYGFQLEVEQGYAPEKVGYVKLDIPKGHDIEVLAAAKGAGIPVRTLRRLNPELGTDVFPDGREIVLEVPPGKEGDLRGWMSGEMTRLTKLAKAAKKPKTRKRTAKKRSRSSTRGKGVAKRSSKTYRVQSGDSLWSIAQANGCSVSDLRSWNKLDNKSVLKPGQTLKVGR